MAMIKKKTWPDIFELVLSREKKFDFRVADFEIKKGDELILEEWDPLTKEYTGRSISKKVGYVGHSPWMRSGQRARRKYARPAFRRVARSLSADKSLATAQSHNARHWNNMGCM